MGQVAVVAAPSGEGPSYAGVSQVAPHAIQMQQMTPAPPQQNIVMACHACHKQFMVPRPGLVQCPHCGVQQATPSPVPVSTGVAVAVAVPEDQL